MCGGRWGVVPRTRIPAGSGKEHIPASMHSTVSTPTPGTCTRERTHHTPVSVAVNECSQARQASMAMAVSPLVCLVGD